MIFYNHQLAGEIGITLGKDIFRLNAELGYFVAKKIWDLGVASVAIKKMMDYIFTNFNIIRINAGVISTNKASMRVLEKNGFYMECLRKNQVIKNIKICDNTFWVKENS